MAATLEVSPPASPQPAKHSANDTHTHNCPSCGYSLNTKELEEARQKIEELEAQMERLKEKATAAGT
jgi:transcription initiation factor IIE alpha subunit